MTINFVEKGAELIGSTTIDRDLLVNTMLNCYLSGDVDYSVHPDQWVRNLQKIDLSNDKSTNIKTIEYFGDADSYDLEVDHEDHQFYLPNGILTSNSHAVAYAIDSYMCAWLMTYYEEEWLSSYLESMLNNDDDKIKAFGEIKTIGYQIVSIDINYASKTWMIIPGKKFMPSLLTCKGIGITAADELIKNQPYKGIEDFLWNNDGSWRHSKFNKKALDALIKIEAFESMDIVGPGRIFENYAQMHFVLVENNDLIKKSSKKDPGLGYKNFLELLDVTRDIVSWNHSKRIENHVECLGSVDMSLIVSSDNLEKFKNKGVKSIDELDIGENDICWFYIQSIITKKTKNNKIYFVANIVSLNNKVYKLNIWGISDTSHLPLYTICFGEIERNGFGYSTTKWKLNVIGN